MLDSAHVHVGRALWVLSTLDPCESGKVNDCVRACAPEEIVHFMFIRDVDSDTPSRAAWAKDGQSGPAARATQTVLQRSPQVSSGSKNQDPGLGWLNH